MLALLATSTLALQLTQQHIAQWNSLKEMSSKVADRDCSGEIISIIEKSSAVYVTSGLTEEFIKSLENIKVVSGDIPEAVEFRNQLSNVTTTFSGYFKEQLDIQKSIQEAQQRTTSTAQSYPTTAAEGAKTTDAPVDPNYEVQSVGGKENPVYGVMSGAMQAGYALTGLGMLAAFFL